MSNLKLTSAPFRLCPTNNGIFIAGTQPGYVIEVRHVRTDQDALGDAQRIVDCLNSHDAVLSALRELQANPNDPRAHRMALDAMKLAVGAA